MRCFAVAAVTACAVRMEDGGTLPMLGSSLQRSEVEFAAGAGEDVLSKEKGHGNRGLSGFGTRRKSLGGACDFVETGSLATQTTQVEELGAPNLVGAELLDLVDNLGVVREDALDALAEAHLALPLQGCRQ